MVFVHSIAISQKGRWPGRFGALARPGPGAEVATVHSMKSGQESKDGPNGQILNRWMTKQGLI